MDFFKKIRVVVLAVLSVLVVISAMSCHADTPVNEKESYMTETKHDTNTGMNQPSEEETKSEVFEDEELGESTTARVEEITVHVGITADWDENCFSLDEVNPAVVNGSYKLMEYGVEYEETSEKGIYKGETCKEVILWNGTYIQMNHWEVYYRHDGMPIFSDSAVISKGYYILRANGTLVLLEEEDDEITIKDFGYFQDGDLVIEYYDTDQKEIYVKQ